MTTIAPIAAASTLTICFPAPANDYDAELFTAYTTGTAAAKLAHRYLAAGGAVRRVVGIVLESVDTAAGRSGVSNALLAFAASLHAGEGRSSRELEALRELCEDEVRGGTASLQAIVCGYFIDGALGLSPGPDGVCELVRQVAMLEPFVTPSGAASKRGRVLANSLRALSAEQASAASV